MIFFFFYLYRLLINNDYNAIGFPLYDKLSDTVLAFDEPGVTLESHFRLNYCAM